GEGGLYRAGEPVIHGLGGTVDRGDRKGPVVGERLATPLPAAPIPGRVRSDRIEPGLHRSPLLPSSAPPNRRDEGELQEIIGCRLRVAPAEQKPAQRARVPLVER